MSLVNLYLLNGAKYTNKGNNEELLASTPPEKRMVSRSKKTFYNKAEN